MTTNSPSKRITDYTKTAVEKAKELVDKFYDLDDTLGYGRDYEHGIVFSTEILKRQSKQCALLTVDETIRTLNEDIRDIDVKGSILLDLIDYWREVKQEIENL